MSYKLISILLLISFPLSIPGTDSPRNSKLSNVKYFGFDYFPFNQSRKLVYESTFGETVTTVSANGKEKIITNESDDFVYRQNFITGKDGIFITRTFQEVDVFLFISKTADIQYSEPALRIPMPLIIGKTWEWNGKEFNDGDTSNVTIAGTVIGEENIQTTAGSFDCLKLEFHIQTEGGSTTEMTEWLAPGIGVVKLRAEIDGVGLTGLLQSILGFDVIEFELKEIQLVNSE